MRVIRNQPEFQALALRGWTVHIALVGLRAYLEVSRLNEDSEVTT
jgi:hypothetical protein